MEREEDTDTDECVDCGATLRDVDPSFVFGERGILCFECAIRRGGQYDAEKERWVRPPEVASWEQEAATERHFHAI